MFKERKRAALCESVREGREREAMKEKNKNALIWRRGRGTLLAARSLLRRWNGYDLRGRTV